MRISDWSSDVCSSDLSADCPRRRQDAAVLDHAYCRAHVAIERTVVLEEVDALADRGMRRSHHATGARLALDHAQDREGVASGTRVYVRVCLGGSGISQKNN